MPLEFQVGEVADRLRRGLTVRGRMPLELDERVVPVTLVEDVSLAPWRGEGHAWEVSFLISLPGAGTGGVFLAELANPEDRVCVISIEQALVSATAGGPICTWGLTALPLVIPTPIGATQAVDVEEPTSTLLPISVVADDVAIAIATTVGNLQLLVAAPNIIPLQYVQRPGRPHGFGLNVQVTAASVIRINLRGRIWQGYST